MTIMSVLKMSPNGEGGEKQDEAAVYESEGKKGDVWENLGKSHTTLAEEVCLARASQAPGKK